MRLVMVSPQRANQIQNIATIVDPNGALTFTSSGSNITAWRRNHVVGQLKGHMGDISLLEPLGRLLISYGSDQKIYFWDTSDLPKSFSSSMKILELNPSSFIEVKEDDVVTSISHPPTYVNKILLGFASGNAQLWNIRSLKLLYEFNFEKEESFENVGSITCIANSPALDIVAIGFSSGMIQLHHLKLDKKIMSFYMDGGHSITSLSFRTDGVPILASGASSGQIAFWDLDQKRLLDLLIEAHSEAVSTLRYLDEEPLLISSSGDNSMKMWIFDSPESTARLLKFRQGHSGNPTRLRFDEEGKFILSASKDRTLRLFSIFRDQQSVELSQGNLSHRAKKSKESIQNLRLPTVTDFDWCNFLSNFFLF